MISLDTETNGVDFKHGAKPFFVTICNEDGDISYWEWDVDPLTREPSVPNSDLREIQKMVIKTDSLILQNPTFDFKALRTLDKGFQIPWGKVRDTLLAGHLLSSNTPHDLTSMTMQYLEINVKKYEETLQEAVQEARRLCKREFKDWMISKAGLPCMPSAKDKTWRYDYWLPRAVAKAKDYSEDHLWWTVLSDYANLDSEVTLLLYKEQYRIIQERELNLIYEERLKILPIVFDMENHGIVLNNSRKMELHDEFTSVAEKCRRVCINISDGGLEDLPVNGRSNALTKVVFGKLGLTTNERTPKGAPKMDKYVLDDWIATLDQRSKQYTFVKNLRSYRKRKTALGYMKSYDKFGQPLNGDDEWSILFPSLNPTGTFTLRWSSHGPNEQQISKQEETNIRYCFGPGPGREWWSLDYDNLELRIPAYECKEPAMLELFEAPDEPPYFGSYHLLIFSILHPDKYKSSDPKGLLKAKDDYKSTWYSWTKNGNFSDMYGSIERSDKLSTADKAYHVPGAQAKVSKRLKKKAGLNKYWIEFANKHGYVETMPDKEVDPHNGYPVMCTRARWGKVLPTVPLNYHVQSTACWVMMRAMIKVWEYLNTLEDCHVVMNVHDELVIDLPYKENQGNLPIASKVRSIMESLGGCIDVKLTCGMDYNPENWAKGISL